MSTRRSLSRLNLDVDQRTDTLTDEALFCRRRGHKWEERAMSRKRYNELVAEGIMEEHLYCANGCGSTWEMTWSLRNGHLLTNRRSYAKGGGYLMPKGQGRLKRDAARVAHFARRHANTY